MMIKFVKTGECYWVVKEGKTVDKITIHYNWYDRSKFYMFGVKIFNRLNDAKAYVREYYEKLDSCVFSGKEE